MVGDFSVGPCPPQAQGQAQGQGTIIELDPTFGSFTLLELVSLVKVFRSELISTGVVQSVDTVGTCTTSYLLARPTCFVIFYSQLKEMVHSSREQHIVSFDTVMR